MAMHWPLLPGNHFDEMTGLRRASTFAGMLVRDKPKIDIVLEDPQAGSFVPSYTTLDRIQGRATITCPQDTPFDGVHVLFQGAAKTFVEKIAASTPSAPRTHAYHNFLRLVQPMDGVELPADKVFKAGATYAIPFTFVVPERALPQACTHPVQNSAVQEEHLKPPPSLGDPMMASDGRSLLDDLAPPMAMISYGIRVIVARRDTSGSAPKLRSVADAMKKLRIVPATEEVPPLTVQHGQDDYALCRTKTMKKGIFKGKTGTLTATAQQPAPLRLPFIRAPAADPEATTTMAAVDLTFEPHTAHAKPPRLGQLWVKLKCATFYATQPLDALPGHPLAFTYDPHRGLYVETVPLSSRRVESVQWERHEGPARRDSVAPEEPPHWTPPAAPAELATAPAADALTPVESPASPSEPTRTDSAISMGDDLPTPPAAPAGVHYTARILVPIELPTQSKSFVPTFHTCLMSRIYALDLAVSAHGSSKKVGGLGSASTLHLKVPLQIMQEGNAAATPYISASEAQSMRARADAAAATQRRASAMTPDANDASSGMADLTLRGARGSVFAPPRWGSVAWGDGSPAVRGLPASPLASPRLNGAATSSGGSDEELVDDDDSPTTRRDIMDALEDDAAAVQRVRSRDDPPEYTAFNGIASRGRGTNMWT